MGRRLLVGLMLLLGACSTGTEDASTTSVVEDGLPFAATTAEPEPTFTVPTTVPPTTAPPPPVTQGFVSPAPAARGNCHPSYPDTCIPPPPPDLDCPDVSARRFKVVPPDPHGFDSDHDGVGCESG